MNFEDDQFFKDLENPSLNQPILKFIECLYLCHTIICEEKATPINSEESIKIYNASSPDELALVNAARHFGFEFYDKDIDNNLIIKNRRTN